MGLLQKHTLVNHPLKLRRKKIMNSKLNEHIVTVSEVVLNQTLAHHQKEILGGVTSNKNSIIIMNRGGSKTFMIAYLALINAWTHPGIRIGCFASSFRQSKLIYEQIKKIIEASPILQSNIYEKFSSLDNWSITFNKGLNSKSSIIQSFPLNDGCKLKGKRYDQVYIDEGYTLPEDVFDMVIRPMVMTSQDPFQFMKHTELKEYINNCALTRANKDKCLAVAEQDYNEYLTKFPPKKIVIFSTAYYDNWLYTLYNSYYKKDDCFTVTYSYLNMPKGWFDDEYLKNQRSKDEELFRMEYGSVWLARTI